MLSHPESLERFCDIKVNLKKKFSFSYSLIIAKLQVIFSDCHSWDEIIPHLYLGQILTVKDAKRLKKQIPNLKLVVSVVEPFEFGKSPFPTGKLQKPDDWRKMGVDHILLNTPDFTANLPTTETKGAIQEIHNRLLNGSDVYVHCKAGMGRSATFVALYLLFAGSGIQGLQNNSLENVYSFLQSKRKQVTLREAHFNKILECKAFIVQNINNNNSLPGDEIENYINGNLKDRLDHYLSSNKGKESISQLLSVKTLMIFGSEHCNSHIERHVKEFINEILSARSSEWFMKLLSGQSSLHQLCLAKCHLKFFISIPEKILKRVANLVDELIAHLTNQLHCTRSELVNTQYISENTINANRL